MRRRFSAPAQAENHFSDCRSFDVSLRRTLRVIFRRPFGRWSGWERRPRTLRRSALARRPRKIDRLCDGRHTSPRPPVGEKRRS